MAGKTQVLKFQRQVQAPASEVYRAFTNPTALRDWLSDAADVQPVKGGRLYLFWKDGGAATGQFTSLDPHKTIAFTWQHRREPEPTRVQVSLKPLAAGTQVTVRHTLGTGKKWADAAKAAQADWEASLENLGSVLGSGIDLRSMRRPRMGIGYGDYNADIAARLGVPVSEGIHVTGTAEGSGAQAAGLQNGDVIVGLDRKKIAGIDALSKVLDKRQAGDTVQLVYYRGGEKVTSTLTLGHPTAPEFPPTAEALTETARKNYQEANAALSGLVESVSEAAALERPAANEWNVKELVAHFVACERDLQSWIAELLNGGNNAGIAQESLEYRPNVTIRLNALVNRYPTIAELMQELERAQAETLDILAALPPEFVARKNLYNRAAAWIVETIPGHLEEHRDQILSTIEAGHRVHSG